MRFFLILIGAFIVCDGWVDATKEAFMKKKDKGKFWMFDEFWESSFDIPWKRHQTKSEEKPIIDRQEFSLLSSSYKEWSNWLECDPVKCHETRFRACVDDSWKDTPRNLYLQTNCLVRYIYEVRPCPSKEKCIIASSKIATVARLPKGCGNGPKMEDVNKMIDGNAARSGWPWTAGLYIKGRYGSMVYSCGVTLLSHGWAVTASECLRNIDKISDILPDKPINTRELGIFDDFEIVTNDYDRVVVEGSEKIIKISHIVFHPDFQVDIALMKMDVKNNEDENIHFPCILNNNITASSKCYVIGWNKNKFQIPLYFWRLEFSWESEIFKPSVKKYKRKITSVLQQVSVSIADFQKCKEIFPLFNLNETSHICATTRSKKSCRGDSGGGLFCYDSQSAKWHLEGITNFVEYQGCEREYEFYVNVRSIEKWISETIKRRL